MLNCYVVGRLDIGAAITSLAQHTPAPAAIHYKALLRLSKYLRMTADWGLIYWRPRPLSHLPPGPFQPVTNLYPDELPTFPMAHDPLVLTGYFDAAHATDRSTRRSVTGNAFTLSGAAIAYRSKLQGTVSTSSTEAKFLSGVRIGSTISTRFIHK
jgi:hypothetical protein